MKIEYNVTGAERWSRQSARLREFRYPLYLYKIIKTKTGVRQSTRQGYRTVQRLLEKEPFGNRTIQSIKTSDAKLFIIHLHKEEVNSFSTIHIIRGVLRTAFQMAVDDDILVKNSFSFELSGLILNDTVKREALTQERSAVEARNPKPVQQKLFKVI